jgi:hypothetical protein
MEHKLLKYCRINTSYWNGPFYTGVLQWRFLDVQRKSWRVKEWLQTYCHGQCRYTIAMCGSLNINFVTFIHLVVCLTTGPKPLPKRALHIDIFFHKIWQKYLKQDRQCTNKCNTEVCSQNYCWCGKVISITYSECVFIYFVVQNAKHLHFIILGSMACLALLYFLHIIS